MEQSKGLLCVAHAPFSALPMWQTSLSAFSVIEDVSTPLELLSPSPRISSKSTWTAASVVDARMNKIAL